MVFLVKTYYRDVMDFVNMSARQFFDYVKNLPYLPDHPKAEIVHRPGYSLTNSVKYRDCDDKSVLYGAYLYLTRAARFRFTAVSENPDSHLGHVLIEAVLGGVITEIDPTYPENQFGVSRAWTYKEPISGWLYR